MCADSVHVCPDSCSIETHVTSVITNVHIYADGVANAWQLMFTDFVADAMYTYKYSV